MSLNIKDEEVHRLAHELAARTGQSMTKVVKEALAVYDAKLKDLDREAEFQAALKALVGSGKGLDVHSSRAADFLYDENGLPA